MKKLLVFSLLLVFSSSTFGQFSTSNKWSYSVFLGGSSMLSDLGGSDFTNVAGYRDIDLQATRPAIGLGLQRHFRSLTISTNIMATQLVASDQFTQLKGRANRNLSVRTDLIEANFLIEIMPFKSTGVPILRKVYVNTGLGLMYFEPRANYRDKWIKLRPLGTEGQNYLASATQYKKLGVILPFGYGYKFSLGRYTTAKLDFGLRKTFTDYLDDVSTVYANAGSIAGSGGEIAAILSDRSAIAHAVGSQRGNPESKDFYFTVGLKLEGSLGRKRLDDCRQLELPRRAVKIQ